MKFFILASLLLSQVLLTLAAQAETRYVSDQLTIFMRSGPTKDYRIVGTLTAGEAVELITEDANNNASQVRLSSGREVWVDSNQLITNKPLAVRLSELQANFDSLQENSNITISNLEQDLAAAKRLASQSQALQQQVTQLEYDKELLEQKNQTLSDRSRYDLLTAGGIVAILGILFGLLLPKLMRRRRNDVWR